MKKFLFLISIGIVAVFIGVLSHGKTDPIVSGAPPYTPEGSIFEGIDKIPDIIDWKRPDGLLRVGLQVGHWKSNELPEELMALRNNTGAYGDGKNEWEVNYAIAQKTAEYLKAAGIEVDILPATVPAKYWADAFVAIHADGSTDSTKTGFKIAAPRRDYTGKTAKIIEIMREEYGKVTGLSWEQEGITRNMLGYYAFSWWRFEHAVHPMTPSIILETGFLTTPTDAYIISRTPEVPARAITDSLIKFLKS